MNQTLGSLLVLAFVTPGCSSSELPEPRGATGSALGEREEPTSNDQVCTEEGRLCPDGSGMKRGPDCTWLACEIDKICTDEARFCPDGSLQARGSNCEWLTCVDDPPPDDPTAEGSIDPFRPD